MNNIKECARAIMYNVLDITSLYTAASIFVLQKVINYISAVVNYE